MSERQPMIGVRVDPEFRTEIKAEAEKRFGGNESLLIREATKVYLRLRRTLGHQYEPTIALWCRDEADVVQEEAVA